MTITPQDLDTIRRIYGAALDPAAWTSILDAVAQRSGAAGVGLFVEDETIREFNLAAVSSIFTPEILREYYEVCHEAEKEAYRHLLRLPARRLFTDDDMLAGVIDPESLPGRAWLRKRLGTRYRAAARLHDKGIWFDVMIAQYREGQVPFSRRHLEPGNLFLPHLAKVVELSRAFMVLRSRFQAVLGALDRYHLGIFILEPGLRVVIRNREADRILDLDDGLSLDREARPRAFRPEDDNRLRNAIRTATDTAQGKDGTAETLVTLARRSGAEPFLAEVCPIADRGAELGGRFAGAFLLVVDPAETSKVSTHGMQRLYGLTAAEAEVCRLLAEGHGTAEIADLRTVSVETVRVQAKRLLHKTGTTSRSQLVRLALTVNLPIDKRGVACPPPRSAERTGCRTCQLQEGGQGENSTPILPLRPRARTSTSRSGRSGRHPQPGSPGAPRS